MLTNNGYDPKQIEKWMKKMKGSLTVSIPIAHDSCPPVTALLSLLVGLLQPLRTSPEAAGEVMVVAVGGREG